MVVLDAIVGDIQCFSVIEDWSDSPSLVNFFKLFGAKNTLNWHVLTPDAFDIQDKNSVIVIPPASYFSVNNTCVHCYILTTIYPWLQLFIQCSEQIKSSIFIRYTKLKCSIKAFCVDLFDWINSSHYWMNQCQKDKFRIDIHLNMTGYLPFAAILSSIRSTHGGGSLNLQHLRNKVINDIQGAKTATTYVAGGR